MTSSLLNESKKQLFTNGCSQLRREAMFLVFISIFILNRAGKVKEEAKYTDEPVVSVAPGLSSTTTVSTV